MTKDRQIQIDLPRDVREILAALRSAGYEAFAVGGCVRDSLLGRIPDDWDITTSASPQEVKQVFRRTVDTGLQHGTVTVLQSGTGYEVTTYRVDGNYSDGRHPDSVTFTRSLAEDLCRRDFTINAMAYAPQEGLVDLFGGRQDLADGVIRAVGEPERRFSEDALRMMRAVRFSAQLGFSIAPETFAAIRELAPTLARVSAERIRVELVKTLLSTHPERIREMYEAGLTAVFLPELDACMRVPQNHPHHVYTVGEHILRSVCAVRADTVLRLTMLLHDIGKAQTRTTDENGTDHFYGHAERSAEMAQEILRRLRFDNETREKTVRLVQAHDRMIAQTPAAVRKAAAKIGPDLFPLLLEVKEADLAAQSDHCREEKAEAIRAVRSLYEQILADADCLTLKDLAVNGSDLIRDGARPGPGLGKILGALLEEVQEEPSRNTRAYLLARARELRGMSRDPGNA